MYRFSVISQNANDILQELQKADHLGHGGAYFNPRTLKREASWSIEHVPDVPGYLHRDIYFFKKTKI